jgi:Glycosyltransferase (GlcNAc)
MKRDLSVEECPHYNQIRSIEVAHHDARGPSYAHHIGEQLMGDEEFCMQIDSHRFVRKTEQRIIFIIGL